MICDESAYHADLIVELATALDMAYAIVSHYSIGNPVTPAVLLAHALVYADNGWEIFPLNGKVPTIKKRHPHGHPCKGECSQDGHGLYDATTDLDTVIRWWAVERIGANIGIRVPEGMFVLDSDPRKPGHAEAAAKLHAENGSLPNTLITVSGRCDGGIHRYYRRPPGKLTAKNLGPGYDIKDHSGYVVAPPSIHPDSGQPYMAVDAEIAHPPRWLTDLIVTKAPPPPRQRTTAEITLAARRSSESVANQFCATTSWADILTPHGWTHTGNDPDADGAVWLHPTATTTCSATVRHGCLFVYSTSTQFEPTATGDTHGYTKFRAYSVLNHGGEESQHMSEAAQALIRKRQ